MFNVEKVDLKTTQLKPFVYPPDSTAEYTIIDEAANSKFRFPKEVAEAVAGGCFLGYSMGYEEGRDLLARDVQKGWYAAYAVLQIDGQAGVIKLKEIIKRNLGIAGVSVDEIDEMAKKINTQIEGE